MTDLIELGMVDFNVILGLDCLHTCYASFDYMTRVVKFQFSNELVLKWYRISALPKGNEVSF